MTQRELERLCALWQKRLRLQDWNVTVRFSRRHELPDCHGKNDYLLRQKVAKIQILEPGDCDPAWDDASHVEATLVHELMHLYWPDASGEEGESVEFETMLNLVAGALVEAYRR